MEWEQTGNAEAVRAEAGAMRGSIVGPGGVVGQIESGAGAVASALAAAAGRMLAQSIALATTDPGASQSVLEAQQDVSAQAVAVAANAGAQVAQLQATTDARFDALMALAQTVCDTESLLQNQTWARVATFVCETVPDTMVPIGESGTSTTSLTVGAGTKSLTTQAGKSFASGVRVRVAADAETYFDGIVDSYDPATGAMEVTADVAIGSGTYVEWTIQAIVLLVSNSDDGPDNMALLSGFAIPGLVAGAKALALTSDILPETMAALGE